MTVVQMQNKENEIKKLEADIAQAESISLEEITELIIDLEMTSDVIGDIGHSLESIRDSIGTRTDNITQLEAKLLRASLESINESLEFKLITNTDFKNKTAAQAMESISDTLSKIPEMIKSFIKNAILFIKNLIKSIFNKLNTVESRVKNLTELLNKSKKDYNPNGVFKNERISNALYIDGRKTYTDIPQQITKAWKAYMLTFESAAYFMRVDFGIKLNNSFNKLLTDKNFEGKPTTSELLESFKQSLIKTCSKKLTHSNEINELPKEHVTPYSYPESLPGGINMSCLVPETTEGLRYAKFIIKKNIEDTDLSNLEWSKLPFNSLLEILDVANSFITKYNKAKEDSIDLIKKLENAEQYLINFIDNDNNSVNFWGSLAERKRINNDIYHLVKNIITTTSVMLSIPLAESYKVINAGLDYINVCLDTKTA